MGKATLALLMPDGRALSVGVGTAELPMTWRDLQRAAAEMLELYQASEKLRMLHEAVAEHEKETKHDDE